MDIERNNFGLYELFIGILAVIVVVITLFEVSGILSNEIMGLLFFVNIAILSIFWIDYLFRLRAADNKKQFFKEPFNS